MKKSTLALVVPMILAGSNAIAEGLFNKHYKALFEEKVTRLTPIYHICLKHCGLRTVQETRVHCSVGNTPAHIGGWENAWQIHEETWLVEESIFVDSDCSETVTRTTQTLLNTPQYWPEDDIWNPVPYEESGLTEFNCSNLEYNPRTNQTADFTYRIVVGYQFQRCP